MFKLHTVRISRSWITFWSLIFKSCIENGALVMPHLSECLLWPNWFLLCLIVVPPRYTVHLCQCLVSFHHFLLASLCICVILNFPTCWSSTCTAFSVWVLFCKQFNIEDFKRYFEMWRNTFTESFHLTLHLRCNHTCDNMNLMDIVENYFTYSKCWEITVLQQPIK